LEQSFAAQQRFVADASHELKTPLMVLRAGVERAITSPKVPAESLQPLDESGPETADREGPPHRECVKGLKEVHLGGALSVACLIRDTAHRAQ